MWKIEYTKRFLKELSKLPYEVQAKAENIVFEQLLSTNPFDRGYLEHMTGYPGKYKIRIVILGTSLILLNYTAACLCKGGRAWFLNELPNREKKV